MAAAHGLRSALPGAFPSTTPPRLFDQLSYPLKTPRSRTHRHRTSASPRSRPQRSRRQSAAARGHQSRQKAVARGQLGHTRQQQDGACRRARGARSPAESPRRRCGVSRPIRLTALYASFATAPAKAGIDACTPHGWRSCFRDWCGDIGDVPRDLAEAALAHSLNATEGAYRRMTAIERRREVMTRYADWLNDERGKVVAFSTSKTASAGADAPGQRAAPLRRGRYAAELYSKPPKIRRHRAGGA
jgi:hypothetical protein